MEATSRQISNRGQDSSEPEHDWNQGYGFQFWRCRHGVYRGDGAFGQFCIVFPEQDAVLAVNSGVGEMFTVLNVVWDKLLPALCPSAAPEDPRAEEALCARVSQLALQVPSAAPVSPLAAQISGRSYEMEPNEMGIRALGVTAGPRGCTLSIRERKGHKSAECAYEGWHLGESSVLGPTSQPMAGHAAWVQPDTLRLTLRRRLTPFVVTVDLAFKDDQVVLNARMNVNFGPTELPPARGTATPARKGR